MTRGPATAELFAEGKTESGLPEMEPNPIIEARFRLIPHAHIVGDRYLRMDFRLQSNIVTDYESY
jgi:hypothetical protein